MTEPTKNEPAFPIVHPPVEGITCGGVEHYGLSLRVSDVDGYSIHGAWEFARAIEAAHSIKQGTPS